MAGNVLFVDTGFWYALQVPDDRHHRTAVETFKTILGGGQRLVTSNAIVGETYTLLSRTHSHTDALRFVDRVRESALLEIAMVDEETDEEAYAVLKRFSDQGFSYVDATSFALMKRRKLRRALAFDRHFLVAGFTRVPQDQAP